MMDSIQKAYVSDVVSIEKVVQAVRQIATFSASSELPFDREDALLFWINKVCSTVNHQMVKDRKGQQDSLMQSSPQKVRLRREQLKALPSIPVMDDIMKDLGDGCCLSVLLHFYCPHLVSLDDLSLQDPMSFAESVHNLNLIEEFFNKYLPIMYPFKSEDLLYSPACLKANVVTMLAELFHTFEVEKLEHLDVDQEKAPKMISHVSDGISAKLPPLPISSATKKSFHNDLTTNLLKNEMRNASSNPELNKIGSSSPAVGQPQLLTKRQKQVQSSFHLGNEEDSLQSQLRRASSLDNMDVGKRSFVAWQKPTEQRQDGGLNSASTQSSIPDRSSLRDSYGSSLLTNVSLDSELGQSMNIDELGMLSQNHNDQMNNNQEVIVASETRPDTYTMPEYADEDDLEVESLTSALSRVSRASENVQPSHANSLEGPPAVAGSLNGHQQAQINGATDLHDPRQSQNEQMRTESAAVQSSPSASYASDNTKSGTAFTIGGEQLDPSCNRKKLTLDIQPVSTGQSRGTHRQQEKLMPAVVRPLKEKSHNANKQDERGVLGRSPRQTVEPSAKMASWGSGQRNSNNDLSPDLEPTTPLSPESMADSLASDFSMRSKGNSQKGQFRVPFQPLNQNVSQAPQVSKAKHGEAFYIHSDPVHNASQEGNVHDSMHGSAPKPASSFTVMDKSYTLETAQQAGIPVVSSMEAEMQRSLQRSQQMMDAGRSGGSPRLSQSQTNTYSHSYPHANPHANPNAYPDQHANPNHMPMHNPNMHSYSPSHSHTPPQQTPPPPPPYGSPHYPNPQYPDPHHSSPHHANPYHTNPHHANPHQPNHHSNPHRISPQYSSPHASPQPVLHGHFHSNQQYTGGGGSVSGGRSEITRFGNPGMKSSVNLSPPHHNGDKESPKLHADQTERESPFRTPVLLTFDSNLSPETKVESPVFHVIPDKDDSQLHMLTNPINQSQVDAFNNHRHSPVDIGHTNPKLSNQVQMDEDPLDDLTQANLITHNSMPDTSDYMTNPRKMTTWVSHSKHAPHINDINTGHGTAPAQRDNREPLQIGLTQVRLRLEEKRRNMEKEKRHLERHWTKQRQRVGKAAFMQVLAIQKRAKENDNAGHISPEGTLGKGVNKPYSKDEIERSLQEAQSRWLHDQGNNQSGKTTFAALSANKASSSGGSSQSRDSDSPRTHSDSPISVREVGGRGSPSSSSGSHSPPQMSADQYNTSLDKMNENMSQLMKEIQKLSVQQEQLKSAVESPRQKSEGDRQTPVSEPEQSGFVLHAPTQSPDFQPFFLGKQASPPTEPDNEPFVLQENPLFSLSSEQMSPPSSTPVTVQSPREQLSVEAQTPKDNYNTYCVAKPKTRPKLDIDQATEDKTVLLSNKRGQQVPPIINTKNLAQSLGSDTPLSADDLNGSSQQPGFHLHSDDTTNTPVVQANTYRAPVGFDIVDDSKPAQKTHRKDAPSPIQPPKLKSERTPRIRRTSSGSSPTKKRPPSVYEIVGETETNQEELDGIEPMVVRPLDDTAAEEIDDSGDSKVLGFVIEQDKSEEDEIAKKREQFLRSRLKKQETEKAKKASREAQAEKVKEQQRIKQDEIEAKKAKEIERREKIRIAYQKKKQQQQDEQDGGPPAPRRAVKKSRPRSRVIVDDNTDYAKPTISSGPPAVSAQDIDNANLAMRQQKSSFTISNGQPERGGGGAASSSGGKSTPPKSSPQTSAPTTPAGLTSNDINKATSPEKQSSIPEPSKRRPPSPMVRPRQSKNKRVDSSHAKPEPSSGEGSTAPPSIVSQDSNDSSGGSASTQEYAGPKLYVKPASKSNRHIITNAIAHVVLAGTVNQNTKDKVLMEVAKSEYKHFVILFRNAGLQFRGIYGYSPDHDEITKFHGTGPRHITPKMIEALYKYNSGDKSFSRIPSKTMSVQIDAVTIANHLWQAKKPSAKKH